MSRQPWGPAAPAPDVGFNSILGPRPLSADPSQGVTFDTIIQKFVLNTVPLTTNASPLRLVALRTPVDSIFIQNSSNNAAVMRIGISGMLTAVGQFGLELWPGQSVVWEIENPRSLTSMLLKIFHGYHRVALDAYDFTLTGTTGDSAVIGLALKTEEGY